jgi:hypothetical protein
MQAPVEQRLALVLLDLEVALKSRELPLRFRLGSRQRVGHFRLPLRQVPMAPSDSPTDQRGDYCARKPDPRDSYFRSPLKTRQHVYTGLPRYRPQACRIKLV